MSRKGKENKGIKIECNYKGNYLKKNGNKKNGTE